MSELEVVAAELLAVPLAEFIAARDSRATATDDPALATRIRSLRKPSPAAWLANLLVREQPDEVGQLLALGADLREAQQDLDARELATLTKERRALVTAMARQAVTLATERGVKVSASVSEELAQTLLAALADAAAGDALRSGRLVRSLAVIGFEAVDLDGALAGDVPAAAAPIDELAERRRERARREAAEAEHAAAEAEAALNALAKRIAGHERRRELLVSELATHEQRVKETKRSIAESDREGRLLEKDRAAAESTVAEADAALRVARSKL